VPHALRLTADFETNRVLFAASATKMAKVTAAGKEESDNNATRTTSFSDSVGNILRLSSSSFFTDPAEPNDLEMGVKPNPAAQASMSKIFLLSRPEWPALVLTMLLATASEVCNLYNPIVMAAAYNAVIDPLTSADTKRTKVRDQIILVFALQFSGQILGYCKDLLVGIAGERVVARLRNRLYRNLLAFELGFFDQRKTGELTSRLGTDTQSIQGAATGAMPDFMFAVVTFIVTIVLMGIISWRMTAYVILGTVATGIMVLLPTAKKIGELSKRYQDALAAAQSVAVEALGNMKTVKAFVTKDIEASRFSESIGDPTDTTCCWCPTSGPDTTYRTGVSKVIVENNAMTAGMGLFFGMCTAVTWLGFDQVIKGEISLGDLTAFNSYAIQILFTVAQLAESITQLVSAKGAAQRVFELLEREPKITTSGDRPDSFVGEVKFEAVTFSYPSRPDIVILKNFSLLVPTNSTTALVGASGSGKSTAISLLQRFYDVQSGRVCVDGRDIRELDSDWLCANIGFVQQEPALFGMSIKDNLTYGLARGVSDKEIEDACIKAHAHQFIVAFPESYATTVGERGLTLSGGQKQRLAIARALLVNPRLLLLDEATSALDAESEHLVQEAINVLMQGRTTLIVAHRLSTVRNADQIVVVDKHAIDDIGTHSELLGRCEIYQELVRLQMGDQKKI
jgi:ATP-binding cassette subfamily B protein